jgi:hypothetical protein
MRRVFSTAVQGFVSTGDKYLILSLVNRGPIGAPNAVVRELFACRANSIPTGENLKMKKVVLPFVFMCLAVSVASASSSCLGENGVAGGMPTTQSLTDQPISSSGTGTAFSGYLDSCAYIGVTANPFGSNDLTFIYQVVAGDAPSSDVSNVTFGDFGSASLQGDQSSLFCSGCIASNSFGANVRGGFIFQFDPSNPIPVGGVSDYLIVYTDQTTITTGLASLHDTSVTGVATDLASLATVPEPGSLALVASGLIGLAGLLRRKLLHA